MPQTGCRYETAGWIAGHSFTRARAPEHQASLEADESGKASTTLSLKSGEGWLKVDTWSQLTDDENWKASYA